MTPPRDPTTKDWVKTAMYVVIALIVIMGSALVLTSFSWPVGMLVWLAVFVAGSLYLLVRWHARATAYRCAVCGYEFTISTLLDLTSPHVPDKKFLKCPQCGKRSWAMILMRDAHSHYPSSSRCLHSR